MRDGGELVGFGMATGVWDAMQMPITVRIRALRQRPRGDFLREPPTSAPAPAPS